MSRQIEMENEVRQAQDEVRRAKEEYAACKPRTPESLDALRRVRDADQRLLDVIRSQSDSYNTWNANMRNALNIIHQRQQNNR